MEKTRTTRWIAGAVVGLVLTVGAGMVNAPVASAESNGGVRVMPLGDSITDGFNVAGGYRIELWKKLVAGGYKIDFVGSLSNGPASLGDHDHEGHSGWTIDQVNNNVVNWLKTTTPRTILLHIGTNDMMSNAATAPTRLSNLLDRITTTAPTADVFVSTIIPMSMADSAVRTFNAAIPGIVQTKASAGRKVHLVDMYKALTTADLADGVHANATGYAKMADAWFKALQSVPESLTGGTGPTPTGPTPTGPTPTGPTPTGPTPTGPTPTGPTPTGPTPTGPTDVAGCSAKYEVINQWQGGFQANVTVTAGNASISGWRVTWTFGDGQSVTSSWNATLSSSGSSVTARNTTNNGAVAAGKSTAFGFTGSWNGTNGIPSATCTAA
ncbi:MAG: hypothetical protein QG622_654 [Actinomycetota bacterium]|nr:hypothetical protein [Actinomycetota bacterium]